MDLFFQTSALDEFRAALRSGRRADYVYMYPPRQAYRALPSDYPFQEVIADSLSVHDSLNLYVHFPYCAQVCHFCNLFTSTRRSPAQYAQYVGAVLNEINLYADLLPADTTIETVYLGGGTPSLFPPELLARVVEGLKEFAPNWSAVAEIALEVDPATVSPSSLAELRAIGINRINLGYQSTNRNEVLQIGRRKVEERPIDLIAEALQIGFSNVCIDLIYGLRDQTDNSWRQSLRVVAGMRPQTICAYALTSRLYTGYDSLHFPARPADELYRRYDLACEELAQAGYHQETPVRWIIPGGGYQQKRNHWSLQNLLGIGAGARSYLWGADLRNGYSIVDRNSIIDRYFETVDSGSIPVSEGFIMSPDERVRKAAILGLNHLTGTDIKRLLGVDILDAFPAEFELLESLGLARAGQDRIELTPLGSRHRDLIAQLFFSPAVIQLLRDFTYAE